jgi:hypothetical protein
LFPPKRKILTKTSAAFSLVELLTVVAIMAIMMGILAMSIGRGNSNALQVAASQVATGMGLARQIAITKNTDALFLIAHRQGSSATDYYPAEAFRYWSVVYFNRADNVWNIATDWTELPPGTVFVSLIGRNYTPVNWFARGSLPSPGQPFAPRVVANSQGSWQTFNSATNLTITWEGDSAGVDSIPYIGFSPGGAAEVSGISGNVFGFGLALAEGGSAGSGQLSIRSTNNITFVEVDRRSGKTLIRPRESYR